MTALSRVARALPSVWSPAAWRSGLQLISRGFAPGELRRGAGTVWEAAGEYGKPPEASWGQYARFLRDAATCLMKGHKEPMMLHREEAVGSKTRMMVRHACARCGRPLEERRTVAQFPRRRDAQSWRS